VWLLAGDTQNCQAFLPDASGTHVTVLHPIDLPNFSIYSVTEANKYSQQELRFMKSQDASYLALKAQTEMKVRAPK